MVKWTKFNDRNNNNELKQFKFDEIGKSIIGTYVTFRENPKYKDNYFLVLSKNDYNYIINCPTNLKYQLKTIVEDEVIVQGDKLCIKYIKNHSSKFGKNPLKLFEVFYSKKEEE